MRPLLWYSRARHVMQAMLEVGYKYVRVEYTT